MEKSTVEMIASDLHISNSFEIGLEETKKVDFIYNLKDKSKKYLHNQIENKLTCNEESKDSIIINKINNITGLEQLIIDFNNTDLIHGSVNSKRLVVELVSIIRCKEFRLTDDGHKIFDSFIEFKRNINVNYLSLYGNIKFDELILTNTVSYIMIACSIHMETIPDFCSELNSLLSWLTYNNV
jgi:hypothetical protein